MRQCWLWVSALPSCISSQQTGEVVVCRAVKGTKDKHGVPGHSPCSVNRKGCYERWMSYLQAFCELQLWKKGTWLIETVFKLKSNPPDLIWRSAKAKRREGGWTQWPWNSIPPVWYAYLALARLSCDIPGTQQAQPLTVCKPLLVSIELYLINSEGK